MQGKFAMPETCGNWLGLVHSYVYNARQTPEIYSRYRLTQWISNLSVSFD